MQEVSADSQWLWSPHLFKRGFPASHCPGCSVLAPACRHHPHKHTVSIPVTVLLSLSQRHAAILPIPILQLFSSCGAAGGSRIMSGHMCKEQWLKVVQPFALVPVSVMHRKPEGIFLSLPSRKRRQNKRKSEGGRAEISSCGAAAASTRGQCQHPGVTAQS